MKLYFTFMALATSGLFSLATAQSSNSWPLKATSPDGSSIKMYEWQIESRTSNSLKARAAISITEPGKADPVFGVAWLTAQLSVNGNSSSVESADINTVKLPGDPEQEIINAIQSTLEDQIRRQNLQFSNEELNSSFKQSEQEEKLAQSINNAPPEIIYSPQPSVLVTIDGTPRLKTNEEWGVETVVNSPYTIIKNRDGFFYLYGGKHWYSAPSATGPYTHQPNPPFNLKAIESTINDAYKKNDTEEEENSYTISKIIVTTTPTELIQTDGEAQLGAVQGTNLLYVRNTDDDLFMDVNSQSYYVLLSGRWYRSKTLSGNWQYVDATKLPADFGRIPTGSEKEEVLASVAGTDAAKDAREDAYIPQTAKVDRNSATFDASYDGDPQFENIEGTSMQYAVNSPNSVVRYRNRYYAVDNGVWFEAAAASGPWVVAIARPSEIALIPPRYPVYHVKYVYIYDVAPDYVYMGYTPGYLNTYLYGPTIVYGTGYHYRPWYGRHYYPRPCTWGYNMRYSPSVGWGFGVNLNFGWLNVSFASRSWGYTPHYGWWGPSAYRPNYCYRGGHFGAPNNYYRRTNNVYINNTYITNNVYNNRRGIVSRDNPRYNGNRGRDWSNNNGPNRSNDRNRPSRSYENNYGNANRFDNNRGNNAPNRNGNFNNNRNNNGSNNIGQNRDNSRPGRQYQGGNNATPRRERVFNDADNNRNSGVSNGNRGNSNNRSFNNRDGERRPNNGNRFDNNNNSRPDRSNRQYQGGNNNSPARQREFSRSDNNQRNSNHRSSESRGGGQRQNNSGNGNGERGRRG